MHRYYARRPHNVFEYLIRHYTRPGGLILDPFQGGGVVVVEGLRAGRKVIGVDLNPMATRITQMEVEPHSVEEFDEAFRWLSDQVAAEICSFYVTNCPQCGATDAIAEWYEWADVLACPNCGEARPVHEFKKLSRGRLECDCARRFEPSQGTRRGERMLRVKYRCPACKAAKEKHIGQKRPPSRFDVQLAERIGASAKRKIEERGLWYPTDLFPDCDRQQDDALFARGIKDFSDFFTPRNLLALSILFDAVRRMPFKSQRPLWEMVFSSALWRCSRTAYVKTDQRLVNFGHSFWMPPLWGEANVWDYFVKRRVSAARRGLEYINDNYAEQSIPARRFQDLAGDANYWLLTRSAEKLPIPDESVDCVITDPPFGGSVQYGELSNFWWVWLGKGLIDTSREAVQSRNDNFPGWKSIQHYEEMLFLVFRECHRVLKPGGWMVLTFHNRELAIWMALHRAARRAGFSLPNPKESPTRGIVYQPPIEEYTTTLHQQAAGAMLGDFIISFKRGDRPNGRQSVLTELTTEEERALQDRVENFIVFQGGADESAIMTCIIPHLSETGLIHRVGNLDFTAFLKRHFVQDSGTKKWATHAMVREERGNYHLKPLDFIAAEHVVGELVTSYLRSHLAATLDDLLRLIYTQLVNSHRPGVEAVNNVLARFCVEVDIPKPGGGGMRKGFALRPSRPESDAVPIVPVVVQLDLFGGQRLSTQLGHDEMIRLLAQYADTLGFDFHVGETEQKKDPRFKAISTQMVVPSDYGLPTGTGFQKIKEIDLLFLKNSVIRAAWEVTTSIDTARVAINDRYRDLFTLLPNLNVPAFVVVRDTDARKALEWLYSPANVQDGYAERIKVVRMSELTTEYVTDLFAGR